MSTHARTKVVNGRQVFKAAWKFHPAIEGLIRARVHGRTLNVFAGSSQIGQYRVDHIRGVAANILSDANFLPFVDSSFDSVIADPPWNINPPDRWAYLREIRRVSKPGATLFHVAPWLPPPWWDIFEVLVIPPSSTIHNCCLLACGTLANMAEQLSLETQKPQ